MKLELKIIKNPQYNGSGYREFEISPVREVGRGDSVRVERVTQDTAYPETMTVGPVFWSVYGVPAEGLAEHLFDRATFFDARKGLVSILCAPDLLEPLWCPFCQGDRLIFVQGHSMIPALTMTTDLKPEVTELDEWQCSGGCCGRSFWV